MLKSVSSNSRKLKKKAELICSIRLREGASFSLHLDAYTSTWLRVTNSDGRCLDLLPPIETSEETKRTLTPGLYKIVFKVKEYFENKGQKCFYPWVEVRHASSVEFY